MASEPINTPDALRAWMRRLTLSLTTAARELGKSRSQIARYLNGEIEIPDTVANLAALLEKSRKGRPFATLPPGRPKK